MSCWVPFLSPLMAQRMQGAILGNPKWQELQVTPSCSEKFLVNTSKKLKLSVL